MTPFEEVTQFINDGLSVLKENAPKKHREVFAVSVDQVFGAFKNLDTSYIAFEIPKKSGEMRQIEAPNRKLKWMQKGLKAQLETCLKRNLVLTGLCRSAPFSRMLVCTWGSGTC